MQVVEIQFEESNLMFFITSLMLSQFLDQHNLLITDEKTWVRCLAYTILGMEIYILNMRPKPNYCEMKKEGGFLTPFKQKFKGYNNKDV